MKKTLAQILAQQPEHNIGTVSSDTLETTALIERFLAELQQRDPGRYAIEQLEWEELRQEHASDEQQAFFLDSLFMILDAIAPPFCYFGAHPDDAACFGFWVSSFLLDDVPVFTEGQKGSLPVDVWLLCEQRNGATVLLNQKTGVVAWTL